MANQRIDIDIKINSKTGEISLKSLDKSFDTLKIKAGQAKQAAKALNIEISKITSAGNVNVAANNFGALQKQIGGASAASGSASSSVLELGRVISDSNYGIRGMANNFSQLASNLLFTAKAAGGFGAALGQVGKALMGPLGLLLLIQTGIALLERFSMQSKKAEEAVKGLGDEIAKETSELEILKRSMENENVTQSQRIELVNDANKKYKDLNISLGENGKLTDESVEAIDRKIFALTRLARANAIQLEIEKEMSKKLNSELKAQKLIEDAGFADIEAFEKFQKMYIMALDDRNTLMSDAMLERQFGEEATYSTGEAGLAIFEIIEAIKDASDVSVEAEKQIDRLIKKASEGNEEIRDIIGFTSTKKTTKKGKEEKILPIDPIFGQDIDVLIKGYDKSINLNLEYQRKLNESRALLYDEQKVVQSEQNREILEEEIAHNEKMLEADMANGEGSMQVIERRNTINNLMIDLRNSDLDHELMIIEQKKNAQMEYVNYISSLGNIFSQIGRKNKDLAVAGLIVQKGAAIAGVVINAQASIAQQIASTNAANSMVLARYLGNLPAAAPEMGVNTALMAKGIATTKLSAGISIASILASTLTSFRKPSGGSSGGASSTGGGGESREFDFNLVGSTGVNQLAEGVAGQFGQPIQAYVVSSQISSQQQLDGIIQSNATIGD